LAHFITSNFGGSEQCHHQANQSLPVALSLLPTTREMPTSQSRMLRLRPKYFNIPITAVKTGMSGTLPKPLRLCVLSEFSQYGMLILGLKMAGKECVIFNFYIFSTDLKSELLD
jgi:hypothetical protein